MAALLAALKNGSNMRFLKQVILSAVILIATLFLWLNYVPGAASFLDRTGVTGLLGIEAAAADVSNTGGGFGPRGPAQVVVAVVTEATTNDRVDAIGDIRALRSATLRTEVSGEVVQVALETGGFVDKDAVILRLDDEAERIAVERARLLLEDARDAASRFSRLQDGGSVTEVRQREAQLRLRTAELELSEAEFALSLRTVRAPFSGWIGLVDVAIGERLSPTDVIATLTDRSEILVDFRVPERVVGQVEPGMPIEARLLGVDGADALTGEIHAVDNVVDRNSRTLRVQGRLANEDDRLRAGMAFTVTLRFPGETLAAVDPLSVQWSSEGSYVWAVRDDKVRRVGVTIRQRDADRVLVDGDLSPGDLVVTQGVQTLRPGAEVAIAGRTEARATLPGATKPSVTR
ncbi:MULTISPECIES: efflux RND transporter periplasmic adaptor subunit [Mameliella]|nr:MULTISPECIES: efflux RND transporter periplasmic adaptor subunit [Mameliella]MCR9274762.1 efflux RND transporter periplasmic adaptor subunit [Paracoccaceae bacterium]MDD9730521.1 efflux RND transporter periplasmic adaptor subunit [Mameliella sp. AT18]